jgi:hypothetical protein
MREHPQLQSRSTAPRRPSKASDDPPKGRAMIPGRQAHTVADADKGLPVQKADI